MSASTAIGMVSASLRNLLVGEMRLTPALDVTVLAPDEPGGSRRVNLFLYKVAENPFLKNQDFTVLPGTPNQLVPAPLSLSLFYLLTSYAPNDPLTGNATAHQILGEAMRVFYENPVVPTTYLDPGLTDARERLPHDFVRVLRALLRKAPRVEQVRFGAAQIERFFERGVERVRSATFRFYVRQL